MAFKEIPDRYLGMFIHFLMAFHNDTSEFRQPHIRKSFHTVYPFFIFLYGLLMVGGLLANAAMIRQIVVQRQQCVSVHKYLVCNSLNDIIKCVVVLPISLSTTLFQNWIYGSFLCYFLPMLQDVPFHATTLTFLLITFDRYRQIVYPLKPRFPSCICIGTVWVASVFAVLPYAIYTRYLDLEPYIGAQFHGTGICAINIEDNIEEYIRILFIMLYVLPLGLIAYLHVKASEEIKTRQSAYSVVFHDASIMAGREEDSVSSLTPCVGPTDGGRLAAVAATSTGGGAPASRKPSSVTLSVPTEFSSARSSRDERCPQEIALRLASVDVGGDDDRDWAREKRIQTFTITVIMVYALCLLPLNLVRLLKHVVYETYENSFHFDITFITVVWIAFVPTVATPVLFRSWHLCGARSNDVSRYLRLGRASDVSFAAYDSHKRGSRMSTASTNVPTNNQPSSGL